MKKIISIILCVVMLATTISASIITTNASMVDEARECEFGVQYSGGRRYKHDYYRFDLTQKSHISLVCRYSKYGFNDFSFSIYNTSGKEIVYWSQIKLNENYNAATEWYTSTFGINLNKGTYYLDIYDGYQKYNFTLDAEEAIKLPKGALTSVKSKKKGQFIAKCKNATDAIGYQFQYSLNERFKGKVKTVKSPVKSKTVKGLQKGKRYYVRVRPYTIYTDGTYVYGQYSRPKSVKIKK